MEGLEVEMKYHKKKLEVRHEIGLLCPMCKNTTRILFRTIKNPSKANIDYAIDSEKFNFYNSHVRNCRGF